MLKLDILTNAFIPIKSLLSTNCIQNSRLMWRKFKYMTKKKKNKKKCDSNDLKKNVYL